MLSTTRLYPYLLLFSISLVAGVKKSSPMRNQQDFFMYLIDNLRKTVPPEDLTQLRKPSVPNPCRTPSGEEGICTPVLSCARALTRGYELHPSVCVENQVNYVCCPKRAQTSKSPSKFSFLKLLNKTSQILTSPMFSLIAVPLLNQITTRISHFRIPGVNFFPDNERTRITPQPSLPSLMITTSGNFSRKLLRLPRNYSHVALPTQLPSTNLTAKTKVMLLQKKHTASPTRRNFTRKSSTVLHSLQTKTSSATSSPSHLERPYFIHESQVLPEGQNIVDSLSLLLGNLTVMSLPLVSPPPPQDTASNDRSAPTSTYNHYSFSTEQAKNLNRKEMHIPWEENSDEENLSQASPTGDRKILVNDTHKAEELIQQEELQFDVTTAGSRAATARYPLLISYRIFISLVTYVAGLYI